MRPARQFEHGDDQELLNEPELVLEDVNIFNLAPHDQEEAVRVITHDENILKCAQKGDYFQFMKNIGGGGAHTLNIKDFNVNVHVVHKTTLNY